VKKRLFLGIFPPPDMQKTLGNVQEQYDIEDVRWTPPENLHITVLFLGIVRVEQVVSIENALEEIPERVPPFTLTFDKLVFMPNIAHPTMIWARFKANEAFVHLVQTVSHALDGVLPLETGAPEEYIPHITLARFKKRRPFEDLSTVYRASATELPRAIPPVLPTLTLSDCPVDTLCLMESKRTKTGSSYSLVERFSLTGEESA